MRESITIKTHEREQLLDITARVNDVVSHSGISNGLVSLLCARRNCSDYDPGELG